MNDHIPPGWYPDPHNPSMRRYWDGRAWTHVTNQDPVGTSQPQPGQPGGKRNPMLALLTAVAALVLVAAGVGWGIDSSASQASSSSTGREDGLYTGSLYGMNGGILAYSEGSETQRGLLSSFLLSFTGETPDEELLVKVGDTACKLIDGATSPEDAGRQLGDAMIRTGSSPGAVDAAVRAATGSVCPEYFPDHEVIIRVATDTAAAAGSGAEDT